MTNKNKEQHNNLIKKIIKEYNDNIIRKILFCLKPYFNYFIGSYYSVMHYALMFFFALITIFNNNIICLSGTLVILICIGFVNVLIHDCPLTRLERKYLGKSNDKILKKQIKKLGIHYRSNNIYEYQLEILTNMGALIAFKIFGIIVIRTFDIKLITENINIQ